MFLITVEKCNNIEIVQLNCSKLNKVNAVMQLWSSHLGVLQKAIGLEQHGIMDTLYLITLSQLS